MVCKFNIFLAGLAAIMLVVVTAAGQIVPTEAAAKLLPDRLGDFRATSAVTPRTRQSLQDIFDRAEITSAASRNYIAKDGAHFSATLISTTSDSGAYAMLTAARQKAVSSRDQNFTITSNIGTSSFAFVQDGTKRIAFFKGRVYGLLSAEGEQKDEQLLTVFGQMLTEPIDKGAGEIPVLVKHLPAWDNAQILYAVNQRTLKNAFPNQPILDALNFEGGAEAASATYGSQKLVIVEFNTASLATDNDQHIKEKLQDVGSQGQAIPTAYRRVGNYAVFVFDAPTQEAANQLIDQVKYQQVVQWLGENPFSYEQATREFTETTLGVFVSVVKASGLALVTCFALGGFLGALLFSFRRAQQRAKDAYSDADAMLRLNLDDLTPESDPARLLKGGD